MDDDDTAARPLIQASLPTENQDHAEQRADSVSLAEFWERVDP